MIPRIPPLLPQKPPPLPRSKHRRLFLWVVGGWLVFTVAALGWRATHQPTPEQIEKSKVEAAERAAFNARLARKLALDGAGDAAGLACQDAVRGLLKAPATAQFPLVRKGDAAVIGEGKYLYDSYVDSQNSFGAMLRTQFTCEAETTDGEHFTVRPQRGGRR